MSRVTESMVQSSGERTSEIKKVFWLSTEFLFILHFLVKVKFTDIALYLGLAFKIDAEEAPLEGG